MGAITRVLCMFVVACVLALPAGATIPAGERGGMDLRHLASLAPEAGASEGPGGTVASAMRSMLNALVGEAVSRSMDDTDLMMILLALDGGNADAPSRWRNPRTGSVYSITSRRSHDATGGECFEYSMEAVNGEKRERIDGIACRQPDGSWTR
jgi:surface antigen